MYTEPLILRADRSPQSGDPGQRSDRARLTKERDRAARAVPSRAAGLARTRRLEIGSPPWLVAVLGQARGWPKSVGLDRLGQAKLTRCHVSATQARSDAYT